MVLNCFPRQGRGTATRAGAHGICPRPQAECWCHWLPSSAGHRPEGTQNLYSLCFILCIFFNFAYIFKSCSSRGWYMIFMWWGKSCFCMLNIHSDLELWSHTTSHLFFSIILGERECCFIREKLRPQQSNVLVSRWVMLEFESTSSNTVCLSLS